MTSGNGPLAPQAVDDNPDPDNLIDETITVRPPYCCARWNEAPIAVAPGADCRSSATDSEPATTPGAFQSLTYSVPQAARLLGINRNTAYQLAARGELPTIRLGKRILVVRTSLEKWLESAGGSLD